jgi:tetratricopeptide (TPR) repeat protein
MPLNQRLLPAVLSLALATGFLGGCADTHRTPPTVAATHQWNSDRANVLYSVAQNQYKTGNFDACRKSVDDALRLTPDSAPIHILSAKLAIEQNQLEFADHELTTARNLDPNNAEAEYLGGVIYQRWQKPQTAYELYTRAAQKDPKELAYIMARAEMLAALDRGPEALALLEERLAYFEHSAAIRDAIGQLLVAQGRFHDGAERLRQASLLAEQDNAIRERLALALYYDKQYAQALSVLNRLMTDEQYATHPALLMALGQCELETGHPRDARAHLELAAQAEPDNAGVYLALAKAAFQLNDLRRADLSVAKAISLNPADPDAQLLLGYLRLRQDRLADALNAFQKANAADRADTTSLCMVGYTLQKMGNPAQAIKWYAAALQAHPHNDLAQTLMAGIDLNN